MESVPAPSPHRSGKANRILSYVLVLLAVLLAVQVTLAGINVLAAASSSNATHSAHEGIGHAIELLAGVILVVGFIAKDRQAGILGIVLFLLAGGQNGWIQQQNSLRALHVLGAFFIVGITTWLLATRHPWREGSA